MMLHHHTLNRLHSSIAAHNNKIGCRSLPRLFRTLHSPIVLGSSCHDHLHFFTSAVAPSFREFAKVPTARNFSSPTFTKPGARKRRKFIPRKAAVELTDKARTFFRALLANNPQSDGIMLNYQQASSGQPRMVFSFGFVTKDELTEEDEGYVNIEFDFRVMAYPPLAHKCLTHRVSLELLEDGTPKPPKDSIDDGLPKLYVHHNAFLKVLGATLDVNTETISPILYDREGNVMDPNA